MKRWKCLLLILACLSQISCAALLTEQEYVLIDRPVDGMATFHGEIYWLQKARTFGKSRFSVLGNCKTSKFMFATRKKSGNWSKKFQAVGFRLKFH